MFDLILFDLDGTLTDPKEGITNCVKYALEHFGIEENDEATLLSFIGPPLYDSFRGLYGFSHEDANLAVEKYRERFSVTGLFENRVLDGAEEILKALKEAGKTLALATSKPLVFAERIVDHYGLSKYLDFIVGADLKGGINYKDEVINEVLRIAKPDDLSKVVIIGDRKHDVLGAKKCNISSIGVKCGYAEENELEDAGADFIFKNLAEVQDFLLNTP
ncbi:MAG: HAD hydrolase-like protein [Clostridia bacterium]|nr:HAD hydrolase-like protein [Clostridia bacterium]